MYSRILIFVISVPSFPFILVLNRVEKTLRVQKTTLSSKSNQKNSKWIEITISGSLHRLTIITLAKRFLLMVLLGLCKMDVKIEVKVMTRSPTIANKFCDFFVGDKIKVQKTR